MESLNVIIETFKNDDCIDILYIELICSKAFDTVYICFFYRLFWFIISVTYNQSSSIH